MRCSLYKVSDKPLVGAAEIKARVAELASEIASSFDYDILLSALTGAYMFTADLSRELAKVQGDKALQKKIAFIKASSYGNSTESSGKLQVSGLERIDFQNRNVLVVDDIADSGNTLLGLLGMLRERGAKEVRSCVLLNKQERRTVDFKADFVGFEIANEFVVGYGLDCADNYRFLPEIWTLQEVN